MTMPRTLSRREFMALLSAVGGGSVCGGGAAALAGCEHKPASRARIIDLGALHEFEEGITPLIMYRVAVVRERGALGVVSLVCTHQVCMLTAPEVGASTVEFLCPCHGSRFSREGAVLNGPATEPLPWFKVWVEGEGRVFVDLATHVAPDVRYII